MTLSIRQYLAFMIIAWCAPSLHASGPSLVLQSPTAGGRYNVGDTMVVRWTIDFSQISNGVMLQVSPDGRYWLTLDGLEQGTIKQDDPAYTGNQGVFRWVVKDSLWNAMGTRKINLVSDSCKVKIYAPYDRDSLGAWPMAVSQGIFRISGASAVREHWNARSLNHDPMERSGLFITGFHSRLPAFQQGRIKLFGIDGSVMGIRISGNAAGIRASYGCLPCIMRHDPFPASAEK